MSSDPKASAPPNSRQLEIQRSNARLGMVLFIIYLAFYAGFVYLTAFSPETMKKPLINGVSVAVIYGFALIVAAFVLAMVYMLACKPEVQQGDEGSKI